MQFVLSAEGIDTVGTAILMSATERDEVILCIEGGTYWSSAIEELLTSRVSSTYACLDKNRWIAVRASTAFCFKMVTDVNNPEIVAQLKKPLEPGRVRTFFLFETGTVATADASINPTRAHGVRLN